MGTQRRVVRDRRVAAFIRWLEHHYTGLHGLMLTHSSLQSGFDSDILTASLPDKSVEGPDTSAFMVLEYQALAELHRLAGDDAAAAECDEKAHELRARMESLLWFEDEDLAPAGVERQQREEDEFGLAELDGILPWPGKSRRRR